MRKTYLLWFAILAFLLLGCRNEDFVTQSANTKREEEFFREAEKLASRFQQSTEIIDLLKKENERSHFVSKMKDQKGLPAWNKMNSKKSSRVAGKEGEGFLEIVIPLTEDQKTLSSLLFITEASDGSLLINNTNNEFLKHIIFDRSISLTERENYLLNFIVADRGVFGTSKYINIPDDLLEDIPVNQENGLKSLEIKSTTIDNDNPQNAASGMICIDIITPNPGCGSCDYPPIIKTICFLVYNPDTGGDGGGSGGGTGGGGGGGTGGGGGGGTPNPGGNNPDDDGGSNDPCYNRAFYRVPTSNLPCDIQIQVSPCLKIKEQAKDENFVASMQVLKNNVGLKKETGFFQKNSGTFVYQDNASATDEHNSLSLPQASTNTYIKGFMHTHVNDYKYTDADGNEGIRKGIKIFSPADISYFMDLLKTAQDAARPLGDVYAVMVSNTANYQIRFTGNQYQIKTFTDAQKNEFRTLYTTLMESKIGKQKSLELGFLNFIYDKMNLRGVALYRMNSDGTTTEIKLNADKTDTIESNCSN